MPPDPAKPLSTRDDALAVVLRLRESGHVAYFAGGCVRDELLGLKPKDFDVATDAPPHRVRELFNNTQAVGAAFGLILVRHRKSVIEVATFRTDGDYSDGRRPDSVRFTTAEEDAQRRDFTINGLFLDPVENRVIDYVGGQADLAAKILRAIGDPVQRFREDHLRLLRAVRFAARFAFVIEPVTADAIRAEAPSLKRISPERIADELRRMLTPPTRVYAWRLLTDRALIGELFRRLGPYRGDREEMFTLLAPGEPVTFPLALAAAALCYQAGQDDPIRWIDRKTAMQTTRSLRTLFKLSNDETESLQAILIDAGDALRRTWTLAEHKRFLARPTAPDTRRMLTAIARSGFHSDAVQQLQAAWEALDGVDCAPPPLVTGDDLVAAGLSPGPVFKRVLESVYDAQLESRVTDKPSAMALAVKLAQSAS